MFYDQSNRTVVSRRDTVCHQTINVKNMYILKLVYSQKFRIILKIEHNNNKIL